MLSTELSHLLFKFGVRFKFNTRVQQSDEEIGNYIAALPKLAENCNYSDKLDEMLRDRLVCGVHDDRVQRLLLMETNLTWDKAVTIASSHEAADKNVHILKNSAEQEVKIHEI